MAISFAFNKCIQEGSFAALMDIGSGNAFYLMVVLAGFMAF